jgi:hypothetical protein
MSAWDSLHSRSHSHSTTDYSLSCTALYALLFPFSWLSFFHNNSPTTSELPIPIL